jgi:hypothetical protein
MIKSAEDIHLEVLLRILGKEGALLGKTGLVVPLPARQPPDASGCNWNMLMFSNVAGIESHVRNVVAEVRALYNLAELPLYY